MSEVQMWKGFRDNQVTVMGTVMADPQFIQAGDSEWAYLTIRTIVLETSLNGQFTEIPVDVPLIASTPDKVRVIKQYVKAGRELYIKGYYKNWDANGQQQHAIFITFTQLGRSPFASEKNSAAPPLPNG